MFSQGLGSKGVAIVSKEDRENVYFLCGKM